jgi:hypothetical protein
MFIGQLIPIPLKGSSPKASYRVKLGIRAREREREGEPVRFTLHLTDGLGYE